MSDPQRPQDPDLGTCVRLSGRTPHQRTPWCRDWTPLASPLSAPATTAPENPDDKCAECGFTRAFHRAYRMRLDGAGQSWDLIGERLHRFKAAVPAPTAPVESSPSGARFEEMVDAALEAKAVAREESIRRVLSIGIYPDDEIDALCRKADAARAALLTYESGLRSRAEGAERDRDAAGARARALAVDCLAMERARDEERAARGRLVVLLKTAESECASLRDALATLEERIRLQGAIVCEARWFSENVYPPDVWLPDPDAMPGETLGTGEAAAKRMNAALAALTKWKRDLRALSPASDTTPPSKGEKETNHAD